ncbi:MAG: hypothetical protein ACRCXY_09780 [Fusobacteriaceae bacterium]
MNKNDFKIEERLKNVEFKDIKFDEIEFNDIDSKYISEKVLENKATIIKFLGYGSKEVPLSIYKKIDKVVSDIENLLDIQYEYKVFPDYAFAIYTVGNVVEEKIKEYMESKEMMNSLILDKAAVVALDCIKDAIIKKIENETKKFVDDEIYPSSANFSINNQKIILESMQFIDKIKINEYFQLFPIKSVGVKFNLSTCKKEYNRCRNCENPCENRKK